MDRRTFFEGYRPTNLTVDPLPLKVLNHSIWEAEMLGHALDWASQYLHQKSCPSYLISPLLGKILKEIAMADLSECYNQKMAKRSYDEVDSDLVQNVSYQPLKLMQSVTAKVDDICLRYKEENDRIETDFPDKAESGEDKAKVFGASYYSIKNSRRTLEDRMVIIPEIDKIFNLKISANYFAVFDGHNGVEAAAYSAAHLHRHLVSSPDFPSDLLAAINYAFDTTDTSLLMKCKDESIRSGTTAVVALTVPGSIYIAWVGDSQAVLLRNKEPINLVSPHKPDREDELRRIKSVGGEVISIGGTWRVNGNLAVSRAIGNLDYKEFVTSTPEISHIETNGSEEILILACDGLWDVISPQQCADIIRSNLLSDNPSDIDSVSQKLVLEAKRSGSGDNITVIVVLLKSKEELIKVYSQEESGNKMNGSVEAPVSPVKPASPKSPATSPAPSKVASVASPSKASPAGRTSTGTAAKSPLGQRNPPVPKAPVKAPERRPITKPPVPKPGVSVSKTMVQKDSTTAGQKPAPPRPAAGAASKTTLAFKTATTTTTKKPLKTNETEKPATTRTVAPPKARPGTAPLSSRLTTVTKTATKIDAPKVGDGSATGTKESTVMKRSVLNSARSTGVTKEGVVTARAAPTRTTTATATAAAKPRVPSASTTSATTRAAPAARPATTAAAASKKPATTLAPPSARAPIKKPAAVGGAVKKEVGKTNGHAPPSKVEKKIGPIKSKSQEAGVAVPKLNASMIENVVNDHENNSDKLANGVGQVDDTSNEVHVAEDVEKPNEIEVPMVAEKEAPVEEPVVSLQFPVIEFAAVESSKLDAFAVGEHPETFSENDSGIPDMVSVVVLDKDIVEMGQEEEKVQAVDAPATASPVPEQVQPEDPGVSSTEVPSAVKLSDETDIDHEEELDSSLVIHEQYDMLADADQAPIPEAEVIEEPVKADAVIEDYSAAPVSNVVEDQLEIPVDKVVQEQLPVTPDIAEEEIQEILVEPTMDGPLIEAVSPSPAPVIGDENGSSNDPLSLPDDHQDVHHALNGDFTGFVENFDAPKLIIAENQPDDVAADLIQSEETEPAQPIEDEVIKDDFITSSEAPLIVESIPDDFSLPAEPKIMDDNLISASPDMFFDQDTGASAEFQERTPSPGDLFSEQPVEIPPQSEDVFKVPPTTELDFTPEPLRRNEDINYNYEELPDAKVVITESDKTPQEIISAVNILDTEEKAVKDQLETESTESQKDFHPEGPSFDDLKDNEILSANVMAVDESLEADIGAVAEDLLGHKAECMENEIESMVDDEEPEPSEEQQAVSKSVLQESIAESEFAAEETFRQEEEEPHDGSELYQNILSESQQPLLDNSTAESNADSEKVLGDRDADFASPAQRNFIDDFGSREDVLTSPEQKEECLKEINHTHPFDLPEENPWAARETKDLIHSEEEKSVDSGAGGGPFGNPFLEDKREDIDDDPLSTKEHLTFHLDVNAPEFTPTFFNLEATPFVPSQGFEDIKDFKNPSEDIATRDETFSNMKLNESKGVIEDFLGNNGTHGGEMDESNQIVGSNGSSNPFLIDTPLTVNGGKSADIKHEIDFGIGSHLTTSEYQESDPTMTSSHPNPDLSTFHSSTEVTEQSALGDTPLGSEGKDAFAILNH